MRSLTAILSAVAGSAAMFAASAGTPPGLSVTGAWARATPPGTTVAAVYLVIDNTAGETDRLLAISTDRAGSAEVHTIVHDGDLAMMRRVEPLHVGAGERILFEPGGTHVMLMGLKSPLAEGQSLTLVMNFERAGVRRVEARVMAATSAPQAAGHHH
jgi:copper(I)-binding protein